MEEWRDITGYEHIYEVSDFGMVRRKDNKAQLRGNLNTYGYRVVKLTRENKGKDFKVHQLVAKAFIPNPEGRRSVNHKDGDKGNNHVDNLEWCTPTQNARHATDVLGITTFAKPIMQMTKDGELIAIWTSANRAAASLGLNGMPIMACCKGTAQTAYGYLWEYANFEADEIWKSARRATIKHKIEELSKELSALD